MLIHVVYICVCDNTICAHYTLYVCVSECVCKGVGEGVCLRMCVFESVCASVCDFESCADRDLTIVVFEPNPEEKGPTNPVNPITADVQLLIYF